MKTKMILSNTKEEHEDKLNRFFETIGTTKKLLVFHKLVKATKNNISYLTYIHYMEKSVTDVLLGDK